MYDSVKAYIIEEIQPEYKLEDFSEIVDLFFETLDYQVDEDDLKGVGKRIVSALESLDEEKQDKSSLSLLLPTICKIEPYARKVLYLVNRKSYEQIVGDNRGFAPVLNNLGIKFASGPMGRAYELRNIEAHACKDWSTRQCYSKIADSLIAYLMITKAQKDQLKKIIYANSANNADSNEDIYIKYANELILKLRLKAKTTVQLESEENLNQINIFAEEQTEKGNARKGSVRELMNTVSEKRMILWGDAGAGKTTTLEYLAYQDAQEVIKGKGKVPVLIYLGSATNEHYTLLEYIQQRLGVEEAELKRLLDAGKVNLYFDGFNEIPLTERNMLKTKRRRELTDILENYKKVFIILTNRPQDGAEFAEIPVFNLLKMNASQVNEFLTKNTSDSTVMKLVNDAIEEDANLREMVRTPLILKSLIFIAKTTGEIPKREGQIIGRFLKALFTREKQEKFDEYLDEKKMNLLLRRIGYETLESNHTNSGVSEEYLLNVMSKCQKDYSFSYDNMYALQIAVHLGILEKRDDSYVFAHQSYQDYYHSQEMAAVLGF